MVDLHQVGRRPNGFISDGLKRRPKTADRCVEGSGLLGFAQILSSALMVIMYALILVSVFKVYQMGTDVAEMKELLRDIKRNTSREAQVPVAAASPVAPPPLSPEALVRAVHAASYEELDAEIADGRK